MSTNDYLCLTLHSAVFHNTSYPSSLRASFFPTPTNGSTKAFEFLKKTIPRPPAIQTLRASSQRGFAVCKSQLVRSLLQVHREQSQLGRRASVELFEADSERCCAVSWGFTTLISESSVLYTTPHNTAYRQALASQESALINNQRTIATWNELTNSNIKPGFNRNPGPYVLFHRKCLCPISSIACHTL